MALPDIATLMTACLPRLRRYARALVVDKNLADDLVQDTLERAWQKRVLWQNHTEMRPWLFGIMHNLHVNHARKGQLQLIDLDDAQEVLDTPTRATQSDRLEMHDLHSALQMLPREQRAVLLLVALEQMNYQEIATALDIPVGTVMSRLSRGREKLRMLMANTTSVQSGQLALGATLPTLKVVK